MRVSVIGCGKVSRCHFRNLEKLNNVTISSVVDIKKERADEKAEQYDCKAYYDYIRMLDEDRPDCVHICTPHYLHVEMATEALKRNINVLCEKPCAVNTDELSILQKAQKESNAQYGVCFQNRYNTSVIQAKNLIDSRKYGKIITARAFVYWNREINYYSDDWHGTLEKECGGVLINQGIHTLDLLQYLTGEKYESVSAHISRDKFGEKIEVEDTALARFEADRGTVAMFTATVGAGIDYPVLIDIVCENATMRIEGNNLFEIVDGKPKMLEISNETEFTGKKYWGNGHDALIGDFYDCLSEGRKFEIDAFEGGKAVKLLSGAYESAKKDIKVKL